LFSEAGHEVHVVATAPHLCVSFKHAGRNFSRRPKGLFWPKGQEILTEFYLKLYSEPTEGPGEAVKGKVAYAAKGIRSGGGKFSIACADD
jgi:hypothetical protein